MRRFACALALTSLVAASCSLNPFAPSPTVATASRLAPATAALDAEVAMPAGFPADFPTYPHARLVAVASFVSSAQVSWGLEWESLDAAARVVVFYTRQLGQGDWTLAGTSTPNGDFAASFVRKSDKNAHGTVYVGRNVSVTRILVSLVYPAG